MKPTTRSFLSIRGFLLLALLAFAAVLAPQLPPVTAAPTLPAASSQGVMVNTNGILVAPTNFISTNQIVTVPYAAANYAPASGSTNYASSVGGYTSLTSATTNSTNSIAVGGLSTSVAVTMPAGTGAYTNSLVLQDAGAQKDYQAHVNVAWPTSTNATIAIYDNAVSGSPILTPKTSTLQGGSSSFDFHWTSTGWNEFPKGEVPARLLGTNVYSAVQLPANANGGLPTMAANNQAPLSQGMVPSASGNQNPLSLRHLYNSLGAFTPGAQGAGQFLTWIATGDSVALFKPQWITSVLSAQTHVAGYSIGEYLGSYGTSVQLASPAVATTNQFSQWPSGNIYTLNGTTSPALIGNQVGATIVSTQSNTQKVYFLTTTGSTGTNTFQIQTSLNGGTWTTATNVTLSLGVTSPAGTGTVTTGNTTCDTNYASVVGGVATVTEGSPGLYQFRVVRQAGTITIIGGATYDSTSYGVIIGSIAYSGIDSTSMALTPPAILNPVLYDINPTVVSFEVKDSVASFTPPVGTPGLNQWQANIGGACPNSDFIDIGTTPKADPADDALGQSAILKANATTLGHFFFDSGGIFAYNYRNLATLNFSSYITGALASGGTSITIPTGTPLATQCNVIQGGLGTGLLVAIWDAGTNPLTNANYELAVISSGSAGTYTITRGVYGTTAVAHAASSNIASGWTNEGVHPVQQANQFMAAQLYKEMGLAGHPNLASNYALGGQTQSVYSNAYSNSSGHTIHLGNAAAENSLFIDGAANQFQVFGVTQAGTLPSPFPCLQFNNVTPWVRFNNSNHTKIELDSTSIGLGYDMTPTGSAKLFFANELNLPGEIFDNTYTATPQDFEYFQQNGTTKLSLLADGSISSVGGLTLGGDATIQKDALYNSGAAQVTIKSATNGNYQMFFGIDNTNGVGFIESLLQGTRFLPTSLNPVSGNVLIGTATDDGSHKLQVNGSFATTGTATIGNGTSTGIFATAATAARTYTFPDASGTVALTGSLLTVQTGTLSSGTATKTVPAGCHPWVQDNASSITNVGTLTVTVSGTTATITSTNALDASPFTLFNAGSQ